MEIKEAIETLKNLKDGVSDNEEAIDIATEAIRKVESGELVEVDGWISVDEPPEEHRDLLVCIYSDGYKRWFKGVYVAGAFFRETVPGLDIERFNATHWQYGPEPPKEKG